jgi:ataxia telangiectasia mutated family protein
MGARRRAGDARGDSGPAGSRLKLMDILRQMGCMHVLDVYVNALPPEEAATPQARAARFEAAWRVGQWDLPDAERARADAADAADAGSATRALGLDRVSRRSDNAGDADDAAARAEADFHRNLHAALAALRAGDVASSSSRLDAIRGALVRRATTEGVEARETSRTAVIRLRMLDDVADAAKLWRAYRAPRLSGANGGGSAGERDASAERVAAQAARSARETWRRRVGALAEQSFRIAEPLLAVHGVVLRELGDDEALVAHLAETASLARKAGESAEGLRAIHRRSPPLAPRRPSPCRCGASRTTTTPAASRGTRCPAPWRGGAWKRRSFCGPRAATRWPSASDGVSWRRRRPA